MFASVATFAPFENKRLIACVRSHGCFRSIPRDPLCQGEAGPAQCIHSRERENRIELNLLVRQAADYLERKRAEEIEETLFSKIQHRSNNQLTVIQTIAHQTLSADRSVVEAKKIFDARLQALARTNRCLKVLNWSHANLSEIVHSALAPFGDRAMIDGVGVMIDAQHARGFSLALHELGKMLPNMALYQTKMDGSRFSGRRIDYLAEGLTCEIDLLLGPNQPGATTKEIGPTFRRMPDLCARGAAGDVMNPEDLLTPRL